MRKALMLFIALGVGCHQATPPAPVVASGRDSSGDRQRTSCGRRGVAPLPARADDVRQGSAVALAYRSEGALAYVADADSHAVHTVALEAAVELGHTRLPGAPRQLLVLADGRVAATLTDANLLVVLEPAEDPKRPMTILCERELPAEPWGIARTVDGALLAVTSSWGAALTVIDAATFTPRRTVSLRRDPRAVVVDAHGTAFVSHAVGAELSVVDLGSAAAPTTIDTSMRKMTPLAQPVDKAVWRTASQGMSLAFARASTGASDEPRLLAPMASVDPGHFDARTTASRVYYGPPFDGVPKQAPIVAVVDPARRETLSRDLIGTTRELYRRECILPRAAATRDRTGSLFVACAGIDEVIELDAAAVDPSRNERRRFSVAPDPEGLAIDETGGRLVVFSQLGAALTVAPLDRAGNVKSIALDYRPDPELVGAARGRQLFLRTDDARIANDGLACASCHIDGRDDGITWSTPKGPRQTPMLAGRVAGSAPYGWAGDEKTLEAYIQNTVLNLGGLGTDDKDAQEIAAYLRVAPSPPRPALDDGIASRGAELFSASGCAGCHSDGESAHQNALGRWVTGDTLGWMGVDTPTLRFVAGTAPYFHDGRYRTLEDLLADPKSEMGKSASLSAGDRAVLAAYLRSL